MTDGFVKTPEIRFQGYTAPTRSRIAVSDPAPRSGQQERLGTTVKRFV